MSKEAISIFWFRRDLRFDDNTGLHEALEGNNPVLPIFIFDKHILDDLEDKDDGRVTFIFDELTALNEQLKEKGSTLLTFYDTPEKAFKQLVKDYNITKVYTNRDYEPYARDRDEKIADLLKDNDIEFELFKDHVILEPDEALKDDGDPYVVFTPYSKTWRSNLKPKDLEPVPSALYFDNFHQHQFKKIIPLKEMGFERSSLDIPSKNITDNTLKNYADLRDYPAEKGTSRLGIHFRFGTVSIRKVAKEAKEKSDTYLNELIWREFYQTILYHFPKVVDSNFKSKYDAVNWRNNEKEFEAWCQGKTGYPIVDAGMRQLNQTGYMHNRIRMVVASFLTKHLLIDWRWGEAYFARKLLDYELASNNGGWQWAAGTGTDAQPYFRIFNPESQTKKFDPELKYIKKWVPELDTEDYPEPIVEHKEGRERALDTYKKALN
ncbi:deoxyribodipyrimidine photo-lyase [Fulvivirga sp. RKSG066]|uniref:cryptochrome/photolyase family protein n=1 Tax=Fulvivirga aurantia TaxID=2529383 RepID=UPI0012BC6A28|nr:deoxyribodipyrimidine photo-lyase [Fulvivirga aurantia]MTI22520.1 deoxyribodipyrimidine photo-lyase [Fulvivirga aurantia]